MTGIRRRNKKKTFVEKQIGILIDFSCVLYHSPADQKLMLTFSPDAYLGIIKHLSKLNEASGLKENIVATLMFYVYAYDTDEHRPHVSMNQRCHKLRCMPFRDLEICHLISLGNLFISPTSFTLILIK